MTRKTHLDELVDEIYNATKGNVTREGETMDLKTIRELVEPIVNLIIEAKVKKKYIYIIPVLKWISPSEFEEKLKDGYYVYHISLLELRNPVERLEELDKEIIDKRKQFNKILKEISSYLGVDEKELEITALRKVMIKDMIKDINKNAQDTT